MVEAADPFSSDACCFDQLLMQDGSAELCKALASLIYMAGRLEIISACELWAIRRSAQLSPDKTCFRALFAKFVDSSNYESKSTFVHNQAHVLQTGL